MVCNYDSIYGIRISSNLEEIEDRGRIAERVQPYVHRMASDLIEKMSPEARAEIKEIRITYKVTKPSLLGKIFGRISEGIETQVSLIRDE